MILTTPNIYVTNFGPALAQLIKDNCKIYYAIGSGDANWDNLTDKGRSNKSKNREHLFNETFRKEVSILNDTDYLDENNDVSGTPTNKLQLRVQLEAAEGVGDHREFGVYVDVSGADIPNAGDGTLILHEIHDKVTKTNSEVIDRFVNLVLMN